MKVLRIAHHAVVSAWRQRERELRAQGVDVELISSEVWNEGGRDVRLDAEGDGFVRGARTIGRHPSVFVYDPRPIWRAIDSNPDLIDLHEEPNALATAEVLLIRRLRGSKVPYLLYSAQNIRKRYPMPFRWLERIALRGAAAAYVCNHEAGEILTAKGLGGPAVEIPLGVDVRTFEPADRTPPVDGVKTIGYVGRLESHKGVDVLLRTVVGHDDWRVELTGDGPQRAELEALAGDLGIADRVRFLGFASGEELAERYRSLDILAVPSLPRPNWLEQFCRVAVEAMASGVPVVASDSGAIPDVVGDAGVLVPPGDPAALAAAIERVLDPGSWGAHRAAGLARSARFTWQNVATLQRELYESVLGDADAGATAGPHVLIVAYGSPDPLVGCLAELGDGLPVTIVDNSSLPETRELAERHGADYVDAGANLGFAGGVNLGLDTIEAAGDGERDVLLLNPDARLGREGVDRMHELLHSRPRLAAVGATQTEPETGARVRVWWPFPTPAGAWIEAVGLGGLRRSHDFAIGSALLLRRAALDDIGRLDERFFLYAEETDWQRRARSRGWDIAVADVDATHEGAGTGGDPRVRERHFYGSAERYIRKHYGTGGWQLYRAGTFLGAAARGAVLPGERGAAARRRAALFRHGPVAVETGAVGPRRPAAPRTGGIHVVHVVCSEAFAGVERYVLHSALALHDAGCRVTVIGGGLDTMGTVLQKAGITWRAGATAPVAYRALRRIPDADVIVTHMTIADLVGTAPGIRRAPVVSVRHFAAQRGGNPVNRVLAKAAARRVAAQLAISRFVAANVEGDSVVVHTGVTDVPDVDEAAREPIVLALQRLEAEKRTDIAIRAWAATQRLEGWRLVIAGEGADEAELRELATRLGVADTVDFVGFQNDVAGWLSRASVLIAPTPREGLGLAVLEAMSYGLPVVAAAGGGHLETVGSVEGAALFAVDDAQEAGGLLSGLITDPERRAEYGRALRTRQREAFGTAGQTAATMRLLDGVARQKGGAPQSDTAGADSRAAQPGASKHLVVASLEAWNEVWRRNQYIVDGLLASDPSLEVLFLEPAADPLFDLASGRRAERGSGLRTAGGYDGRLHLYQPTKALPRRAGRIADDLVTAGIRRAVSRLGWRDGVLWINDPGQASLIDAFGWPSLYDMTDDWVAAERGEREHDRIAAADAELLRRCDEVVVCSTGLESTKGVIRPVHLIPNAVDVERYRRPAPRPADLPDGPVALYAGTLHEDRLDVDLVLRTADAAANGTVVLVGPDALAPANSARLSAHPRIVVAGARPRDEVPGYLQHANVLIVPHVVDDFTESLDPIKLYEYRAVGRPTVSTPVAGFRDAEGVETVSAEAFPAAVAAWLDRWEPTTSAVDVPDWKDRVADFGAVLGGLGLRRD